jgi:hypothetical protein
VSRDVVVTGSSIGKAASPKKPLTPPLRPTSTEEARCAGGRFAPGSIERIAALRHLSIAASTALLKRSLATRGIIRSTRATGWPA